MQQLNLFRPEPDKRELDWEFAHELTLMGRHREAEEIRRRVIEADRREERLRGAS